MPFFNRLLAGLAVALLVSACSDLPPAPITPAPLAPLAPAGVYAITLSSPSLHIVQGGTTAVGVTLARTNFSGDVTLGVDLSHAPLPPGVTAAFAPNPVTGTSSLLTLTVGAAAAPGVYDLSVYGNEMRPGVSGFAPLTLTITAPPALGYSVTVSPSALSIAPGAAAQTTVDVLRDGFSGTVELFVDWFDRLPPGVTGQFRPNPAYNNSFLLSITVSAAAVPGVYDLYVFGRAASGEYCCVPLRLTVLSP